MIENNVRIKVTSDNKGVDETIKKLEKLGDVDSKNAAQFKKHNAEHKAQFQSASKEATGFAKNVESQFSQLGAQIMGYMALDKLIGFLKDSAKEFIEAEKNAARLGFAIEVIGGQSAATTKKLIEQSSALQENSIFSDDSIQQAQTALATYGLTGEQIEKLIPQILDLASASGTDLGSATETVIKGLEGQTRGLKLLGIGFKGTGDATENLAILTEKLTKFQGASAEAMTTTAGKTEMLTNRIGELKESIGEFLVNDGNNFLTFFDLLFGKLTLFEYQTDVSTKAGLEKWKPVVDQAIAYVDTIEDQTEKVEKLDIGLQDLTNSVLYLEELKKKHIALGNDTYVAGLQGEINAVNYYYAELTKLRESILNPQTVDSGGDGGGIVDKLTDLTEQIRAIYAQMWLDQLNLQRNALKKKALEDKKYADENITDIVARNQSILAIDQKLYSDLQKLDEAEINKKADADKAKARKEHASKEQINELVIAIEDKRNADIIALDEKYSQDKITNEEENWELMMEQLDKERDELIDKKLAADEDLKKLEIERYKETQELRIAQTKINSKEETAAKLSNLKETFEKEMNLLEIQFEQELILEEDFLRRKALLIANYNRATEEMTKESAEKQKSDLIEIFDLMASVIFERINQMLEHNIEVIDRQQSMVRDQMEHQRRLAEQGRENTLAPTEAQFAELEKQRMIEQEKMRKAKELEIFLNSVIEFSKTDPNTALAKAIAQMALIKGAEALYMEEGGIIGETSARSNIGMSRRHPGGGDVLVHAQTGEGMLSRDEMSNLGRSGFYDLKSMLSKPLRERAIPLAAVVGVGGIDKHELAQGFNMVVDAIKSKKETHFEVDHMNNWVVKQIEHGMAEVVTHINRKPRING